MTNEKIANQGTSCRQTGSGDVLKLLLVSFAVVSLTACADPAGTVRKVTYPADFKYISKSEFKTTMRELMNYMRELDHAVTLQQQSKVVRALAHLERSASTLEDGQAGSTHSFLQQDLSRFLQQLRSAKMEASAEPPVYRRALVVVDECGRCHRLHN